MEAKEGHPITKSGKTDTRYNAVATVTNDGIPVTKSGRLDMRYSAAKQKKVPTVMPSIEGREDRAEGQRQEGQSTLDDRERLVRDTIEREL